MRGTVTQGLVCGSLAGGCLSLQQGLCANAEVASLETWPVPKPCRAEIERLLKEIPILFPSPTYLSDWKVRGTFVRGRESRRTCTRRVKWH